MTQYIIKEKVTENQCKVKQEDDSRRFYTLKQYVERYTNKVSHDHRSYERSFSNCVEKPERVRTSTGFEPVTSRYRCDALTN